MHRAADAVEAALAADSEALDEDDVPGEPSPVPGETGAAEPDAGGPARAPIPRAAHRAVAREGEGDSGVRPVGPAEQWDGALRALHRERAVPKASPRVRVTKPELAYQAEALAAAQEHERAAERPSRELETEPSRDPAPVEAEGEDRESSPFPEPGESPEDSMPPDQDRGRDLAPARQERPEATREGDAPAGAEPEQVSLEALTARPADSLDEAGLERMRIFLDALRLCETFAHGDAIGRAMAVEDHWAYTLHALFQQHVGCLASPLVSREAIESPLGVDALLERTVGRQHAPRILDAVAAHSENDRRVALVDDLVNLLGLPVERGVEVLRLRDQLERLQNDAGLGVSQSALWMQAPWTWLLAKTLAAIDGVQIHWSAPERGERLPWTRFADADGLAGDFTFVAVATEGARRRAWRAAQGLGRRLRGPREESQAREALAPRALGFLAPLFAEFAADASGEAHIEVAPNLRYVGSRQDMIRVNLRDFAEHCEALARRLRVEGFACVMPVFNAVEAAGQAQGESRPAVVAVMEDPALWFFDARADSAELVRLALDILGLKALETESLGHLEALRTDAVH